MKPLQNNKHVLVTSPAAIVDNGSFTTNVIDRKDFDYCHILILIGATDIAFAALKLQESNATASATALDGNAADVDGADFSSDGTLPAADADNTIVAISVDCRNRKRYLDLVATAGDGTAGTFMAAVAILSNAKELPTSLTEKGLGQHLIV